MSCGVGRRLGLDLSLDVSLLWLWCRLAAAAPIQPLAWEPPYATGAAQEIAKRQKRKEKKRKEKKDQTQQTDWWLSEAGPVGDGQNG